MDSIRNPFFASAVATVDRVLAAQVTSIFSTQILDNLKPSDIGAAAGVTNNILTTPSLVTLRADGVNLLAATGTRTLMYTVPSGFKFTASSLKVIITSTNQSVAFTTAPSYGITTSSGSAKCINDLTLSTTRVITAGDVFVSAGSYGSGSTGRVVSTDTVGFSVVTPAFAGGTQSTMVGTVIILGELYS